MESNYSFFIESLKQICRFSLIFIKNKLILHEKLEK